MHPILFSHGSFILRWYGLMAALGFLLAWWVFEKRAAKAGLSEKDASNLLLILFFSGILGARIYYVLLEWKDFRMDPSEIWKIHHGGLVFFGGFIASVFTLVVWCRRKRIPLAPVLDSLAIPLALGHALGRIGCFMNGCCYGKPTDLPWAVRLSSPPEIAGHPIHPTQLYESFGLFFIAFSLLVVERIPRYPGQTAGTYTMLYSLLRFIVEIYRGDVPHTYLGHLTLAQIICIVAFIVAWLLSAREAYHANLSRRRTRRSHEAAHTPI